VRKSKRDGVEPIAELTRQGGLILSGDAADGIEPVADEWVTPSGEVDPDLMRTAGLDADLDEGRSVPGLEQTRTRSSGLSFGFAGGDETQQQVGDEADRLIDELFSWRKVPLDERAIAPLDASALPGGAHMAPRVTVSRKQNDPGGASPETVQRSCFRMCRTYSRE
jgi:hypothetical protein